MYKVLIVEHEPMARKLLEIYINNSKKYNLSHSIGSAEDAELCCLKKHVDLVLINACTAMVANGLDATARIKKRFPKIKIIIITSQPECSFIDRARESGVESFWYKNESTEEILEVMDRTMAGESVYPDATPTIKVGDAMSTDFTKKELAVLREVVGGASDADIADKLHLSLRTVKGHVQAMRAKTGFRNRTELAVRVRESGFVINDHKPE